MKNDKRICLGAIASAHGVQGQVKIRSFTEEPEAMTDYGPLHDANGKEFRLTIVGAQKEMLLARIEGVQDRNAAEMLRGTELYINRAQLPEPDEDDFYYEDLIGLDVQLEDGSIFGSVRQIYNFGSGDMLEIETSDGVRELAAFTKAQFPQIDVANGFVRYHPAEVIE